MKGISLFTGIGAMDLGAEMAGIETIVQVEIETVYHEHLQRHWPRAKRYADIKDVQAETLPPVDIVFEGDPCQPNSIGGKRKGTNDPRFLWPEMLRIIKAVRPSWIVNENVVGSISNMVLDRKVSDLENQGYTCQAYSLCSYATGGNNQRQRIFLVAHAGGKLRTGNSQDIGTPKPDGWLDKTLLEESMENQRVLWDWQHARGQSGRIYPIPAFGRISPMPDVASELAAIKGIGNGVNPWIAFELFRNIKIIHELS